MLLQKEEVLIKIKELQLLGYIIGCRLTESFEIFIGEKGEIISKGVDNI